MTNYYIVVYSRRIYLYKKEKKDIINIPIFETDGNYTTFKASGNEIEFLNDEIPFVKGNRPSTEPVNDYNSYTINALADLLDIVLEKIDTKPNNIYVLSDVDFYRDKDFKECIKETIDNKFKNAYKGVFTLQGILYGLSFYLSKAYKNFYLFINDYFIISPYSFGVYPLRDVRFNDNYDSFIEDIYYSSNFNNFYDYIPRNIIARIIEQGLETKLNLELNDVEFIAKDRKFIVTKEKIEEIYKEEVLNKISFINDLEFIPKVINISMSDKFKADINNICDNILNIDLPISTIIDYLDIVIELNNNPKLKFALKKIKVENDLILDDALYFLDKNFNIMGREKYELMFLKVAKAFKL